MAHAQKPDFVFQRKGRVHLYRRGCQFSRLLDRPCSDTVQDCWLPTPFASFPFTSPPVLRRVPPDSVSTLPKMFGYSSQYFKFRIYGLHPMLTSQSYQPAGSNVSVAGGEAVVNAECAYRRTAQIQVPSCSARTLLNLTLQSLASSPNAGNCLRTTAVSLDPFRGRHDHWHRSTAVFVTQRSNTGSPIAIWMSWDSCTNATPKQNQSHIYMLN